MTDITFSRAQEPAMPFERYLAAAPSHDQPGPFQHYQQPTLLSSGIHFQLPHFMQTGPPALASGGGAEVVSAAFFNSGLQWGGETNYGPQESECKSSKRAVDYNYQTSGQQQLNAFVNSAILNPQFLIAPGQMASSGGITSPTGLPLYSVSGFDIISVLARVATRPEPKVFLGPVDLTSAFVVADVRRHDHPIIYCSQTFCRLTGYEESEILGRNCRFLQSPNGIVTKGETRTYTSHEAVVHLKKSLVADKECQTSIMNYRKDGTAFLNLVTVIPITGGAPGTAHEGDEVVYHVGFQVDLTEQPNNIMRRLANGNYFIDQATFNNSSASTFHPRERKVAPATPSPISHDLKKLLANPKFVATIPISPSEKAEHSDMTNLFSLMLLQSLPDFIHVVSLKGSFLYVAPTVRDVLGYEPEELIGKSLSDFCYPADVVPVMRELKESSATWSGSANADESLTPQNYHSKPRAVDLLFRARIKEGRYVWLECRGRLYVEPGKGRKAIVLSGRAREMPALPWGAIARNGGVSPRTRGPSQECWGYMSIQGSFLSVGEDAQEVVGWNPADLTGRLMTSIVADEQSRAALETRIARLVQEEEIQAQDGRHLWAQIFCRVMRQDGQGCTDVIMVLYRAVSQDRFSHSPATKYRVSPAPLIYQLKIADAMPNNIERLKPVSSMVHPATECLFAELETTRNSSWQYEIQQVKFANQKLIDAIRDMETDKPQTAASQISISSSSSSPFLPGATNFFQQGYDPSGFLSYPATLPSDPWRSTALAQPLKRSWDTMIEQAVDRGT
ncbi:blue light receptor [Mycena floridula]|nr:blue light receptor [Mycena floridula]